MAKKASKHSGSRSSGNSIDDLFKKGTPSRGFSNLPQGTYEGFVKPGSGLIEKKSKDSEDYKATIDLIVTEEGKYENREQRARYDLSTQVGVDILMGDIEAMELGNPTSLAEAADMLAESDRVPVSFWVSEPKDEFPPKVRINERLEGDSDASEASGNEKSGSFIQPNEEELTAENITTMSEKELTVLAEDNNLNPDDYETWEALAAELVGLLV